MTTMTHQYIERETGRIRTETLLGDRMVGYMYGRTREDTPWLFAALTSARASEALAFLQYDRPSLRMKARVHNLVRSFGIDLSECVEDPQSFASPREVFERKIRYWETRPMVNNLASVVSPADARMLVGSLARTSALFLKEKFFSYDELLGRDKTAWLSAFAEGDYAVFRLTPEKYHYNHWPVSGRMEDCYGIAGAHHSCNPAAVVELVTPFSKNKRVVTIIDTDVPGGTRCGMVAMIEIVALMVGDIMQCYSEHQYDRPVEPARGMFVKKGQPKSLFRPGSSTDVVIFQKERVEFSKDLIVNLTNQMARSRFSEGFGKLLVETEVKVRSEIAVARSA